MLVLLPFEKLDNSNAKEFKETMRVKLQGRQRVILELSKVKFIDSSGLGALLSCIRILETNGGTLKLAGAQKQVRLLFDLVRLGRIIELHHGAKEALSSFSD